MDEGLLSDLLECSVCLERLDTSSRVLPCQHTFCLKCLKEIVESNKELRCPECRIRVETKVEDLPPNVLLMRILEGMKNSAPRKTSDQTVRSGHSQIQQLQQSSRSDKQSPPHARAIYDYISKEPGHLSFKKGETIILQKKLDLFWYQGEISGRTGMFPATYVQVVVPLPMVTALCKALYDFRMSAPDEEGCLAFNKGAIISVHRRVDENWAEGRLENRVGIFPIAFVELNQAARQLLNSKRFSTPVTRPVPPAPEHARHADRHHTPQHQHRYQQLSISTPNSGQGNYQNMATMSQSQTNYHANHTLTVSQTNQILVLQPNQILVPQPNQILVAQPVNQHVTVNQSVVTGTRNIMEPATTHLDLIHFTNVHNKNHQTVGIQSVPRIGDNYDRLRSVKLDNYSSSPIQKVETNYQNVRAVNFTNNSSDSSSSVNTPSVNAGSSTTTPNTSSNTSTSESAEPSLVSTPENVNVEQSNVSTQEEENQESLDASGALSLNESSTATNTSLNVSLPSEIPKNQNQNQTESEEVTERSDEPSSSKYSTSGPNSLLTFGLGLQAELSPSHKDGTYMVARSHREHRDHRDREKRHSLTPSSHMQNKHAQNRHSAEILATSLLDHSTERERERPERDRERRRRRSGSNDKPLPSAYIALYPYKPQKPDELELKKGGVYTVTERCRDGWYKGSCERASGVFPGNYVAPLAPLTPLTSLGPLAAAHRLKHYKQSTPSSTPSKPTAAPPAAGASALTPPDAPPRASSPHTPHSLPLTSPWTEMQLPTSPRLDKPKKKSKSDRSSISTGVSLMKRLAVMKKCKSPPPAYSMDNPVFEDAPGTSQMMPTPHPVHVRSGSCPSQLLRALPAPAPAPAPAPPRARDQRPHRGSGDTEWAGHRKSASLDVTGWRDRHHSQSVKEKFRCIVPYPPNSEYELELKVDDIVIVCKKRGDGWYKGTLQRTGRTGLFPASFVQSCPPD